MKKPIFLLLALLPIFLMSACVQEKKYMNADVQDYIVCSFGGLPTTLDMMDINDKKGEELYKYLFEGLVNMNRNKEILPALAESWEIDDEGIQYTFHIREDACWSDGTTINSKDIENFFKYILSKEANNPMARELFPIFGAEDYYNGKIQFHGVAVMATDTKTLVIRLNRRCPEFLEILSKPRYVLRKGKEKLENWKGNHSNIAYSGPFIISDIDKKGLVLRKNPSYWNSEKVTDESFLLLSETSREKALAAYEAGQVDILYNPPVSEVEGLISSDNTIIVNSDDQVALTFNERPGSKGAERNLKKEIMKYINVEALVREGLDVFNTEKYDIFKTIDLEEGLLNSGAGLGDHSDETISVLLVTDNDDINKRIAKELVEQLKESEKIKVKSKYIFSEQFQDEIEECQYDIILRRYKKEFIDSHKYFLEDHTIVPLFNSSDMIIKNKYIKGVKIDAEGNVILNRVYQK